MQIRLAGSRVSNNSSSSNSHYNIVLMCFVLNFKLHTGKGKKLAFYFYRMYGLQSLHSHNPVTTNVPAQLHQQTLSEQ